MDPLLFQTTLLLRIASAVLFGFMLGFEREITGKFAGLRTHILVSVGSAVFTLLSIHGFKYMTAEGLVGINDPARVAAQIITGIGFIGAGTVMRQGTNISGITTAATLWVSAAVGMACGCGMFFLATIATVASLIVLTLIRHFERKFLLNKVFNIRHIEISFSCPLENMDNIYKIIEKNFEILERVKKKTRDDKHFSMKFNVATRKNIAKIHEIFKEAENLSSLEISEVHE